MSYFNSIQEYPSVFRISCLLHFSLHYFLSRHVLFHPGGVSGVRAYLMDAFLCILASPPSRQCFHVCLGWRSKFDNLCFFTFPIFRMALSLSSFPAGFRKYGCQYFLEEIESVVWVWYFLFESALSPNAFSVRPLTRRGPISAEIGNPTR